MENDSHVLSTTSGDSVQLVDTDKTELVTNKTNTDRIDECLVMNDDSLNKTPLVESPGLLAQNETDECLVVDNDCAADKTPVDGSLGLLAQNKTDTDRVDECSAMDDDSVVNKAPTVGSLGLLAQYASSSDDEEDDGEPDTVDCTNEKQTIDFAKSLLDKAMSKEDYRVVDDKDGDDDDDDDADNSDDSGSSYTDDSDIECVGEVAQETIDITNDDELKKFMEECDDNEAPKGPIKAKGEFGLADLPPIADLTITVSESECIQLGTISGVVDTLVLVDSLPNFAAVDIDTVLFLDKGNRTLGQVFDVMGNVASPIYCVRFNRAADIVDKAISVGDIVYVAPKTEHTNFIVLAELMNQRGTDASWEDDIEPPTGCGDFSDDEEERVARRTRTQRNRSRNNVDGEREAVPSKVTVKQEQSTGKSTRGRNRWNATREPRQFYKDNRGYANTSTNYTSFNPNRQTMQQYNHSWHTANMMPSGMPPTTAGDNMPMPPGYYPNPFAMNPNAVNYGYFNMQAFPPLPPPLSMLPPTHAQQQHQQQHQQQQHRPFGQMPNKRNGPSQQ